MKSSRVHNCVVVVVVNVVVVVVIFARPLSYSDRLSRTKRSAKFKVQSKKFKFIQLYELQIIFLTNFFPIKSA